ncbi:MAG: hypothetical protein L0H53_13725 [Candidatus Nitrosocosmicus sp.]|nr:hypothetical protein [Candidatus Nitrosocosmicus sp.]
MVEKIQQQQQDQKEVINKNRSINKIINSLKTIEGDGFIVNRSFPTNSISYIDPFYFSMKWVHGFQTWGSEGCTRSST